MKLTELNPHWITFSQNCGVPVYIGMTFRCPHCPAGDRGETGYIAVYFDKPVDPEQWLPRCEPLGKLAEFQWHRVGETFETLTLTPSINAGGVGHWHGWITNGEIH